MATEIVAKQSRLPRATKVLSTIVLLRLPFTVSGILVVFRHEQGGTVFVTAAVLLSIANSAVNIVIYSPMNADFPKVFY